MVRSIIYFALLIFILGCNPFVFRKKEHCELIKDYMKVEIEVINPTLKMGDTLYFKAKYYNFSDSTIIFRTNNHIYLSNPDLRGFVNFGNDSIHEFLSPDDYKKPPPLPIVVEIPPKTSYIVSYKVKFFSPVFKIGVNNIKLCYVCKSTKLRIKGYNYFCGYLLSPTFQVELY